MDCKERILSNDYADGVIDFAGQQYVTPEDDVCYIPLDDKYSVIYASRSRVPDILTSTYQYQYIPKLYGLMQEPPVPQNGAGPAPFDPSSLIASGILRVQNAPLNLKGRGVVLCLIDTGAGAK